MTPEEFKEALRELGWKQADIGRKMDLHRNTVSAWAASGPPGWAVEYLNAMLAIKRLHEVFVKAPPIERRQARHEEGDLLDGN
ncbi:helix-turn-helix transcriptional regulator [Oxalobacter sp. OttesenSCG-928-P03]|nr:helix-turn-helix transcriptional regulator [Oxalobacter sp. OttesenSCG-928-P03]